MYCVTTVLVLLLSCAVGKYVYIAIGSLSYIRDFFHALAICLLACAAGKYVTLMLSVARI